MKKLLFSLLILPFACNGMDFSHDGKKYSLIHNELGVKLIPKKDKPVSVFQTQFKKQDNGSDRVEFVNAVNRSQDGSKIIMEVEEAEAHSGTNANSLSAFSHKTVPSCIDNTTIDAKKILVYDLDTKKTTECPVPSIIDPVYKILDSAQAPDHIEIFERWEHIENIEKRQEKIDRDTANSIQTEKEKLEDMGYECFDSDLDPWCMKDHYRNPIQHICVSNDGKKAIVGNRSALFQVDLKTHAAQELDRKKCLIKRVSSSLVNAETGERITSSEKKTVPLFQKIEYSDKDDSLFIVYSKVNPNNDGEAQSYSFINLSQLDANNNDDE